MDSSKWTIDIAPRGRDSNQLLPEESASFDLTLRYSGEGPAPAASLNLNQFTPVILVFDGKGRLLARKNTLDMEARLGGSMGEPIIEPPQIITLAAGQIDESWIDLWHYTPPLPPGRYEVQVEHILEPGVTIQSARLPIEIVTAEATGAVIAYDSLHRDATLLYWLSAAAGQPPVRLLRQSIVDSHRSGDFPGTRLGTAEPGTQASFSALANDGRPVPYIWLAELTGSSLSLMRQRTTVAVFKSDPIPLDLPNARLVPRFPDRGFPLVLAFGGDAATPTLAGVSLGPKQESRPPWNIPLSNVPTLAVCAFNAAGPIHLLIASQSADELRLSRISISDTGTVESAQQDVFKTPHRLLAMNADQRPGAAPAFVAVVAPADKPHELTLVNIGAEGPAEVRELGPIKAWPQIIVDDKARPSRAVEPVIEIEKRGETVIAFLDETGALWGGRLDGSPVFPCSANGPLRSPHIAALNPRTSLAAFDRNGYLLHWGAK